MNASSLVLKVAVNVLRIAAAAFIGVNPVIAYVCQIKAAMSSQNLTKHNILSLLLAYVICQMSGQTHECITYAISVVIVKTLTSVFHVSVLLLIIDFVITLSK